MSSQLTRSDGNVIPVQGYLYQPNSGTYTKYSSNRTSFPSRVDLRPFLTPIEDQEQSKSCVAQAIAGAYEYLLKRHKKADSYDVSTLFIYYNGRISERQIADQGSHIETVIESVQKYGACSEELWPFDLEKVNDKPSDEAYEEGSQFVIEHVSYVDTKLDAWKQCLADGYPIVFGLKLYSSFDQYGGRVPVPTEKDCNRRNHSSHAMLCVGYSDKEQVFIVRNSWGENFGDKGYCYIPYAYMINPRHNLGDSWIFRQMQTVEMDDNYWETRDELFQENCGIFYNMSTVEYAKMLANVGEYSIEQRLAHVMVCVAGADSVVADEEEDVLIDYLEEILEEMGIQANAKQLLKQSYNWIQDTVLFEASLQMIATYLPKKNLAYLHDILLDIASADGLAPEEEKRLAHMATIFQIDLAE